MLRIQDLGLKDVGFQGLVLKGSGWVEGSGSKGIKFRLVALCKDFIGGGALGLFLAFNPRR